MSPLADNPKMPLDYADDSQSRGLMLVLEEVLHIFRIGVLDSFLESITFEQTLLCLFIHLHNYFFAGTASVESWVGFSPPPHFYLPVLFVTFFKQFIVYSPHFLYLFWGVKILESVICKPVKMLLATVTVTFQK